jgi:tRNA A37 threonylcarbamoyltransferase TsaD
VTASYPPIHLCTGKVRLYLQVAANKFNPDNAAMIGWASMYRFLAHDTDPYDINLRSRWPIDET